MNKFIKTLIKEKKIQLVEISENIVESYINKSNDSIKSGNILHNSNLYDNSVSMSYYSMYHITLALLFKVGIKCENHTGVIVLLDEFFQEKELSKKLKFAKKERVDKQYYADHKTLAQESENMLELSKIYTTKIKSLIENITNNKAQEIKNKLIEYQ